MEDAALVEQVRRRPAIWNPRCKEHSLTTYTKAAWRQVCKHAWPDFDKLPPADKRDRCLELQKRWLELRQTYYKETRGKRRSQSSSDLAKSLGFLADVMPSQSKKGSPAKQDEEVPAAKRSRSDTSCSETEVEEDRHFLLSLVSFMQDVPRTDRLALRQDMLALVGRYARGASASMPTGSQQY